MNTPDPHQPAGLIPTDHPALPLQQRMHLPDPVDAIVLRMQPHDRRDQQLVPKLPG